MCFCSDVGLQPFCRSTIVGYSLKHCYQKVGNFEFVGEGLFDFEKLAGFKSTF